MLRPSTPQSRLHHRSHSSRKRLSNHTRTGVAAVEFALIFPVALLFFITLITFVHAFIIRNAAENAAYFAARKGIIPGSSDEDIAQVIDEEMQFGLVNSYNFEVERSTDVVLVTVSVPMRGNSWASGGFAPSNLVITQQCSLQKQER